MIERILVSIGTTHPWNVAGIGVDARIASEYGLRHAMAIVALTAQDEGGLREKFALPAGFVRAQLESLPSAVAAFRVGALFDERNVREVARFLGTRESAPAVVDPVFADSFGNRFATDETVDAFRDSMLPLASILTPNIPEAERLLERSITSVDAMVDAARALQARGSRAILLKGGHLRGNPVDVLQTAEGTEVFADARVPAEMRGTGCTLAAVIACELAQNQPLVQAVIAARAYVRSRLAALVE
jgi:hydroxymethylpyrimidine/phosphomethylpyrimidine kinase